MKMTLAVLTVALGWSTTTAASVVENEAGWYCGAQSDWRDTQIIVSSTIILNNFIFREREAFLARNLRVLEVSSSATNRSDNGISFGAMVVGQDSDTNPTFGLYLEPSVSILSSQRTETISSSAFIRESVLSATKNICMMFIADQ